MKSLNQIIKKQNHTFAVVFFQDSKAFDAIWIACLVSSTVRFGTVVITSFVAGSN